jgi:hypothetical protein
MNTELQLADELVLGTAEPPHPSPQLRLSAKEQEFHGLIWGSIGTGKSKFLQTLLLQHINKGHGVCLLDPHSDLSLDCLRYLTAHGYFDHPEAFERLVYVDFGSQHSLPFNVLSTSFDPHSTALNVLEALTRTWPDLKNAPLFRTLFLSSAVVLIANNRPLTEINDLLLDADLREEYLQKVDDPLVRRVFQVYGASGNSQAGSTLRRAFLLSFSPITRGCLGQVDNVLNMRALMDEGRSLIVNLGSIPDVATRRLIGSLMLVQIEQAALSRGDIPENQRRPWTCMVDEWPAIAADQSEALENVLTQARKYKLRLYLAAQALAQVDSRRLAGALEQCRLSVTFRVGVDSARIQAKHIASIVPRAWGQGKGAGAPPARSEQMDLWVQTIANMPPREAFVKIHGHSLPVRIKTLTVENPHLPESRLQEVVQEYRRRYQRMPDDSAGSLPSLPPMAGQGMGDAVPAELLVGAPSPLDQFATFFGESDYKPGYG